jgi:DNA-directed RNA polymerase specialized sigma24 family protein
MEDWLLRKWGGNMEDLNLIEQDFDISLMISELRSRDGMILKMYLDGNNYREIGESIDTSVERARQLVMRGIERSTRVLQRRHYLK